MLKSCLILILGLVVTATTRESIGCEPDRMVFRAYKDRDCRSVSRSTYPHPISAHDVRKIVADKCYPYKHGSFKGKCDYTDSSKRVLKEVEFKPYTDNNCRDKDTRRLGSKWSSKGKIEYEYKRCAYHPFYTNYYTMLEFTRRQSS
jgi:hypothetical protein